MWGQPPSAVRPGKPGGAFLASVNGAAVDQRVVIMSEAKSLL